MKSKEKPKQREPALEKNWPFRTLLAVLLMVAAGAFGWWWKDQVLVRKVDIKGIQYADEAQLREMIRVDSSLQFFNLDPVMLADRVRRHPWVEEATVHRFPNATLNIEVTERRPAMLLIDKEGRPGRYLDAAGFQMPFMQEAVFDVPLLAGLNEPINTLRPIKHSALLILLQDLKKIPPEVDALISSFEVEASGEIKLHTAPKPGRGSIEVLLGRNQFLEKLSKLYAFWHKAVLTKEEVDFASIDLRFDSQIITKEVRLSQ